jgi:hypothetical protein
MALLGSWGFGQAHNSSSFDQVNHIVHIELTHNVTAMVFNCADGTVQCLGYFLIAPAL